MVPFFKTLIMEQDTLFIHMLESSRLIMGDIASMFIKGEPGVGKTHFAFTYAEYLRKAGYEVTIHFIACNAATQKPEMMYQFNTPKFVSAIAGSNDHQDQKTIINSQLIQGMIDSHKNIQLVIIDELDKADEEVDSFLLTPLEEGICTDPMIMAQHNGPVRAVKENFIVIATTNDTRQLLEALNRRGDHVIMEFPSKRKMRRIVSKMIEPFKDDLTPEQVSFAIDFMYKYRELGPRFTMVQTQLVRLLSAAVHAKKYGDYYLFERMFRRRLSPYEGDLLLLDSPTNGLKHICKMIYG